MLLCKDRLCFVSSMIGSYSQEVSQVSTGWKENSSLGNAALLRKEPGWSSIRGSCSLPQPAKPMNTDRTDMT